MNVEALWRNQGQVLTPELITGLIGALTYVPERYIDFSVIEPESYGAYTFHVERYADALPELSELHKLHWLETEKHRHGIPLKPDYNGFVSADRSGGLVLFTIRKAGELVGQSTMKVYRSMHTQTLAADEDSLFLRADHRGGRTIFKFIAYMDKVLTGLHVKEVRVSSKLLNSADKLMMRCGFKPFATQLVKMLGVSDAT